MKILFDWSFVMASFDIRLLYTSIPPQETMDMCVLKLFEEKTLH